MNAFGDQPGCQSHVGIIARFWLGAGHSCSALPSDHRACFYANSILGLAPQIEICAEPASSPFMNRLMNRSGDGDRARQKKSASEGGGLAKRVAALASAVGEPTMRPAIMSLCGQR